MNPISPPPFQWDHWYSMVGGRKISIPEVNEILRKIYEDQYPRFHGPVASEKVLFSSAEAASAHIKETAIGLGANLVGICEIEPSDVYAGKKVEEKYAIALGQTMRYKEFLVVPSEASAIECLRVYYTLGEVVIALANHLRSLGYDCKIEHPIGDSDLLHIPIGLKAGFGELGRHGSIIHPEVGPLFRMGSVITSLEMAIDQPIDAGIADFCDKCRACRIYCPANAIPDSRSPEAGNDHLGNPRYLVDTGKCFPYFSTHYYCSACLPVCVYNHKEWAKDFENGSPLPFPEVVFQTPPPEIFPEHRFPHHPFPKKNTPPEKGRKTNK